MINWEVFFLENSSRQEYKYLKNKHTNSRFNIDKIATLHILQ